MAPGVHLGPASILASLSVSTAQECTGEAFNTAKRAYKALSYFLSGRRISLLCTPLHNPNTEVK